MQYSINVNPVAFVFHGMCKTKQNNEPKKVVMQEEIPATIYDLVAQFLPLSEVSALMQTSHYFHKHFTLRPSAWPTTLRLFHGYSLEEQLKPLLYLKKYSNRLKRLTLDFFSQQEMTVEQAKDPRNNIVMLLRNYMYLEELVFKDAKLEENEWQLWFETIEHLKTKGKLKRLEVHDDWETSSSLLTLSANTHAHTLSIETCREVKNSLLALLSLKHIIITHCIQKTSNVVLRHLLMQASVIPHLEELTLRICCRPDVLRNNEEEIAIVDATLSLMHGFIDLTTFTIENNHHDYVSEVLKLDEVMIQIAQAHPKLRELSIDGMTEFTGMCFRDVHLWPNLSVLKLTACPKLDGKYFINDVLQRLPTLETVFLTLADDEEQTRIFVDSIIIGGANVKPIRKHKTLWLTVSQETKSILKLLYLFLPCFEDVHIKVKQVTEGLLPLVEFNSGLLVIQNHKTQVENMGRWHLYMRRWYSEIGGYTVFDELALALVEQFIKIEALSNEMGLQGSTLVDRLCYSNKLYTNTNFGLLKIMDVLTRFHSKTICQMHYLSFDWKGDLDEFQTLLSLPSSVTTLFKNIDISFNITLDTIAPLLTVLSKTDATHCRLKHLTVHLLKSIIEEDVTKLIVILLKTCHFRFFGLFLDDFVPSVTFYLRMYDQLKIIDKQHVLCEHLYVHFKNPPPGQVGPSAKFVEFLKSVNYLRFSSQ
jgi:hypothetical protein